MEAWRQWRAGEKKKLVEHNEKRIDLTPTGLLMEGDYTQNPDLESMSVMAIFHQLSPTLRAK